jgi:hypothetical protein
MRRRTFLAAAAATAALPATARAAREPRGEVGILQDALALELLAVYVYDAGIKSGLLDEATLAVVGELREHEQQHADAIGASLEALGGGRPLAPKDPADADAQLATRKAAGRLLEVKTREDFFGLAHEVELLQVGAYVRAAGELGDVRLIQTTASIAAAQGTHLVVLRALLGDERVPVAFERGPR